MKGRTTFVIAHRLSTIAGGPDPGGGRGPHRGAWHARVAVAARGRYYICTRGSTASTPPVPGARRGRQEPEAEEKPRIAAGAGVAAPQRPHCCARVCVRSPCELTTAGERDAAIRWLAANPPRFGVSLPVIELIRCVQRRSDMSNWVRLRCWPRRRWRFCLPAP